MKSEVINNKIKISIIVPVYNSQEYIEKCLCNCLDQDLDGNEYEVIVVNDGSSDESRRIIEAYAEKHNTVRIINQEHSGSGAARNRGIKEAKGEYLWFVDGDDWIDRNCLKLLYYKVSANDLDLMWIRFRRVDHSKNTFFYPSRKLSQRILCGEDFLDKVFTVYTYVWLFIIRRTFLLNTGCIFTNGIVYEDAEFMPKVIMKAERVKYEDIICYNYVKRADSIINSIDPKKIDDLLYVIKSHIKIIHSCSRIKIINYFKKFITHLVIISIRLSSHPNYKHKQKKLIEEFHIINIRTLKVTRPLTTFIGAIVFNLSPKLLLILCNIGRQVTRKKISL